MLLFFKQKLYIFPFQMLLFSITKVYNKNSFLTEKLLTPPPQKKKKKCLGGVWGGGEEEDIQQQN
jgi:hypothetical protein